ncbi:unnamed protein product [Peniophora sp. CBMAI 1063]|nr:unnamed protein product [Peniophora sp. CBMAI 1063]
MADSSASTQHMVDYRLKIYVGGLLVTRAQLRVYCTSYRIPPEVFDESLLKCTNDLLESKEGGQYYAVPFGETKYNGQVVQIYMLTCGATVAFEESEERQALKDLELGDGARDEMWEELFPSEIVNVNEEHFDYNEFPKRYVRIQWPYGPAMPLPYIWDYAVTLECKVHWVKRALGRKNHHHRAT